LRRNWSARLFLYSWRYLNWRRRSNIKILRRLSCRWKFRANFWLLVIKEFKYKTWRKLFLDYRTNPSLSVKSKIINQKRCCFRKNANKWRPKSSNYWEFNKNILEESISLKNKTTDKKKKSRTLRLQLSTFKTKSNHTI
jgi:hypothetical protein